MLAGVLTLTGIGITCAAPQPSTGNQQVLSRQGADAWKARRAGGRVGIGISLGKTTQVIDPQGETITKVEEGSTAEDAGLLVGDRVIAIDGKPLDGLRAEQAEHLLRTYYAYIDDETKPASKEGDIATLTVVHSDSTTSEVQVKHDIDGGLGLEMRPTHPKTFFLIDYVDSDGAAHSAGIEKDDRLVAVNGTSLEGANADHAIGLLRGYLGDKVSLTFEHDTNIRTVELTRGIIPSWDSIVSVEKGGHYRSSIYGNPAVITLRNMAWQGDPPLNLLDAILSDKITGPTNATVLDLRGSSGSSVESAARVAARFIEHGTVIRYMDSAGNSVSYEMDNGTLYKVQDGHKSAIETVTPFKTKLAVLIDGGTDGVAVALARALRTQAHAILVGTTTGQDAAIRTLQESADQAGQIQATLVTIGTLSFVDGSPFASVAPTYVSHLTPSTDVFALLNGKNPWLDQEHLPWVISIGGSLAVFGIWGIIALLLRAFRKPQQQPTQPENTPEAEDKPKPTKTQPSEENSDDTFSWWGLALIGFMFAILGAFIFVAPHLVGEKPPIGGHAGVVVELDYDHSAASVQEKAVVEQLQSQLQGEVKFDYVDIVEHPEYRSADGPKKPFAVEHAPMIWVYRVYYDRNGKETSRGGSGGSGAFSLAKRKILQEIRWNAASDHVNITYTPAKNASH